MSLQIGIVGLPNVGKSTLFQALTKKQVAAENYPFCTIDPNVGVVEVPDPRLETLAKLSNSAKILPTTIEFVDIAGLVAGASKGEGLGNKFLSHIRDVDAIVEVVRHFEDDNITHVAGKIEPESDKETIDTELALADLETVEKRLKKLESEAKGNRELKLLQTIEALKKLLAVLSEGKPARIVDLDDDEKLLIKGMSLLTRKPLLYINNIDEHEIGNIPETDQSLSICAKLESDLVSLSTAEVKEYLESVGIKETGLDKLIVASYKLLELLTFFTSGPIESRAWTVKRGAKAPQAAGVIHTDFEKGFIRSETISYNDFVACGGELGAKEKGLMRLEGKEYEMQDGDVCHFRFSV
ncbi:MAG: redox-regulated ATPase YchF [Candidatus Komeilibacteria bacterium CG_4_9_14_0_8_um_filter_36_9]|uniref:Ribosome-binding ATPase YchF n=1 Tax=Candidatus Komeilibacteria bacterium CG_4_9_14_0_8_um_filter_36_9 TaxID=1974473 RepID=A0A2M8DSG2_9BACT|nr:MAG: redox-regulated ATPase YchF [Candidatus Komeilibacteria bacterium CG_4_9_14_0_8_um_filter_36_9]